MWRSSFNTPPSYIFGVGGHVSDRPAYSCSQYDNADGKYANRVFVSVPRHYGRPTVASTTATSGGENNISPIVESRYQHSDTAEQGPTREGAVVTETGED